MNTTSAHARGTGPPRRRATVAGKSRVELASRDGLLDDWEYGGEIVGEIITIIAKERDLRVSQVEELIYEFERLLEHGSGRCDVLDAAPEMVARIKNSLL